MTAGILQGIRTKGKADPPPMPRIVATAQSAPMGRNMPAQGNALCLIVKNIPSPDGGATSVVPPLQGLLPLGTHFPGRCPGLASVAPLALNAGGDGVQCPAWAAEGASGAAGADHAEHWAKPG